MNKEQKTVAPYRVLGTTPEGINVILEDEDPRVELARVKQELAVLQLERVAAAGELRVNLDDMPPGSLVAKLVSANRLLRSQKAESGITDLSMLEAIHKGTFGLKLHKLRALGFIEGTIPKKIRVTPDGEQEIRRIKSRS